MTRIPVGVSVGKPAQISRRKFLRAGSVATVSVLVAGCLGDDSTDDDQGENATEEQHNNQRNGEEETSEAVPADFDDRNQLREYSKQYIELLATGEYDTAAAWFDGEEGIAMSATELQSIWSSEIGESGEIETFVSVSYLGNNVGVDTYTVWTEIGGEAFEFTIGYTENGISLFEFLKIEEWSQPAYVDDSSFVEEEFALDTPLDCELGGTLSVPDTADQVPGVVLVHGNGPQDRDTTVGPNRPFRELAHGLASVGIAVFRYDKRTFACEPDHSDVTVDDVVTEDALTAISQLRDHEEVDEEQIWVIGHSFGGAFAPRIADMDGNVAGTVMLAPGPARPIEEMIRDQVEHNLDQLGATGEQRQEVLDAVSREGEKIRTLDIGDDEVVRFGGREFHETLQQYDPITTAKEVGIPQLLIQGGQDWQVTVEDDLPVWKDGLKSRDDVEITVYDDLNHLFQKSEGERTQQEYVEPNSPVDERVITETSTFVRDESGDPRESVSLLGKRWN